MIINFDHAKKVATGCLAMTSCAFFLWVNQNSIHADTTTQNVTTQLSQSLPAEQSTSGQENSDVQPASQVQDSAVASQANQTQQSNVNSTAQQSNINWNDHGNYAYLDQHNISSDGQLNVSGWNTTNASQGRDYHYIIALDQNNHEIGRQNITDQEVSRPDVARAYPLYGAGNSGFSTTFDLSDKLANLTSIKIISRYTSDPAGNSNYVDYWFAPIIIDRHNYGNLDSATVKDNQLAVKGWHATNQAADKSYHYVIVYDQTAGHEVARQLLTETYARPDVTKVFPGIYKSDQSGFEAHFNTNKLNFHHSLQIIDRYSSSADGNSHYVDYWFSPITSTDYGNFGYLDNYSLANGTLTVSGWHANDISQFEDNHHLILFDDTANRQVTTILVNNGSRSDVARVYPNVKTAGNSGFTGTFNLNEFKLKSGHTYSLVSRYSTSSEGNGDGGQYTDYWFPLMTLNQQAYYLDHLEMTKEGLNVSGWVISDYAVDHPYAYLIVMNNGKEVGRQRLNLSSRPDVGRAYSTIYDSDRSGFSTQISLNPETITGNVSTILRYTNDSNGNGDFKDQYSPSYATDAGYFDSISIEGAGLYVSGWHISNQTVDKPYQYLIFLNQNGQELYRQQVLDINRARPDVAKLYPVTYNSGHSGYQLWFTIPDNLRHAGLITVIHRYTDDPAGNGNFVDYRTNFGGFITYNMYLNSINAYIAKYHVGHATIQTDYVIPEVTGAYSDTSDGKPNMVVVHETANPNDSIWGEINYERDHYDNAFVHAFVDGNNIIEISPTDREAWGAGYPANGRAVQFEQVEVYGRDNFVRELVNGAYYTAYKMQQYGIVPTLAWYNSQTGQYGGTLWSHHMVSQYMHVTDHTDPDGYWTNRASLYFGTSYTMSDFFELVKYEYSQL